MSRIALILGAGPGVGHSVTAKLSEEGYKVAAASAIRTCQPPQRNSSRSNSIFPTPRTYRKCLMRLRRSWEASRMLWFTTVVIALSLSLLVRFDTDAAILAYASTFSPDHENILSGVSAAQISSEFTINTVSYWAAAQAAVAGWEKLDPTLPKAFIYTGNVLPWLNIPFCVSLGIGKASSALIAESLASTYGKRGFR